MHGAKSVWALNRICLLMCEYNIVIMYYSNQCFACEPFRADITFYTVSTNILFMSLSNRVPFGLFAEFTISIYQCKYPVAGLFAEAEMALVGIGHVD